MWKLVNNRDGEELVCDNKDDLLGYADDIALNSNEYYITEYEI